MSLYSDCRNLLYDKSASFRCDGRLFHRPSPAAANALSPKALYVRVTTHVRLAVERRSLASTTRMAIWYDGEICQTATDERASQLPCMTLNGMYKQICSNSKRVHSVTNDRAYRKCIIMRTAYMQHLPGVALFLKSN